MAKLSSRLSRRTLLTGAAAAAIAPAALLDSRRSRAETAAFAEAQHVLVLFARGGLRSHCLFNAVGAFQHNPYGTQPGASGTQWTVGALMGEADIATASFGTVPGLHQLTNQIAVLTSVDLEPEAPRPLIDHAPALTRLGTGIDGSGQGLLSRLRQAHPRYADGISVDNLPPIDIGNTTFARTDNEYLPLRLPSASATAVRRGIAPNWASAARDQLDAQHRRATPEVYAERVQQLADGKANAFDFSEVLVDPRLDVIGAPDAEHAGVTNAELLEVLGDHDLADLGDPQSGRSWGSDVALAVRALGFGSPMVVVERDLYDTHSDELEALPVRAEDLVRQLGGLRFLLGRMEHPEGGSYWDKTVVTVLSEFNRNNTEADTGFNSGNGSDHQLALGHITRNQAIPLMGGPIERAGLGGLAFGSTDAQMNPQESSIGMRRVYSTLMDLLGASYLSSWSDEPLTELFG